MARVVLFGGNGFIGSALRAGLGDYDLVAPPRSAVDLADRTRLATTLRQGDLVINAAGYAAATDQSQEGLERFIRDNVTSVRNLADAADAADVAHLVHLSSVAAMGQREGLELCEDDLAPPRSPYARSKREAEIALADRSGRTPITILRPTSVFGEGRGLTMMLCRIASMPVVPLPAGGSTLIPFSYVGNLVAAVLSTLGNPATYHRTFIVGDERSYALREVVAALAQALGNGNPRTVPVPANALRAIGILDGCIATIRGHVPLLDPVRIETLTTSVSYSAAAFRATTGFVTPFNLESAAERIGAWYLSRRQS